MGYREESRERVDRLFTEAERVRFLDKVICLSTIKERSIIIIARSMVRRKISRF
jgi:hypothetical protein